jgi:hypothetical protein
MAKFNWIPFEDMDNEDGTHTCYIARCDKHHDLWLVQMADDTWDVEFHKRNDGIYYVTVVTCKTLTSAKRYATRYF